MQPGDLTVLNCQTVTVILGVDSLLSYMPLLKRAADAVRQHNLRSGAGVSSYDPYEPNEPP